MNQIKINNFDFIVNNSVFEKVCEILENTGIIYSAWENHELSNDPTDETIIYLEEYDVLKLSVALNKIVQVIQSNIEPKQQSVKLYAYKFNEKSDRLLSELTQSRVYKLWEQAEKDVSKISEQDIDWLTEQINQNAYFKNGSVPFQGWAFDFAPVCKTFWVKTDIDSQIHEVVAPSEEACRRYVNNHLLDEDHFIIEIR